MTATCPSNCYVALRYLLAKRKQAFISRHLADLDARRRRRRHGAGHRAGADDRPAGRAARPHPRLDGARLRLEGRRHRRLPTPKSSKLRQMPHVDRRGAGDPRQGADHQRAATRRSSTSRASIRRSSRASPTSSRRCASGSARRARRRDRRRVAGHPARQGPGRRSSASTVGDTVQLLTPQGTLTPMGMMPRTRPLRRGRHRSASGCSSSTRATASSSLDVARARCSARTSSTLIQLRVDDMFAAPRGRRRDRRRARRRLHRRRTGPT